MNNLTPSFQKDLTDFVTAHSISLRELAQKIDMMINREDILSRHNTPISQDKKDKRWRTRLGGKQVVKTYREDLEDAIIAYYTSLPASNQESSLSINVSAGTDTAIVSADSSALSMTNRTLKTIYPEWIEIHEREVDENTVSTDFRNWKNYIEPSNIADIPLTQLTCKVLKVWALDVIKANNLTYKYFGGIKSVINLMLNYAVEEGYIEFNHFKSIRFKKHIFKPATFKEENEEVFTEQEQELVMQEAELDSQQTHCALPLGICMLFLTGMRIGELCGLQYGDIKGNYVYINRMVVEKRKKTPNGYKHDGYRIVDHPKTSAGNRKIYLTAEARAYFEKIKALNKANGYSSSSKDLIFQRPEGMCNQRVFDSRLRKYCNPKHLDLPFAKSAHDIRRTYISSLFDLGLNPDKIRRIAGHEQIEMTLKYCRNRKAQDEFEQILEQGLSHSKGV